MKQEGKMHTMSKIHKKYAIFPFPNFLNLFDSYIKNCSVSDMTLNVYRGNTSQL